MNVIADALHRRPGGQIFTAHLDRELAGFLSLQVHDVQVAAVFVDDGAGADPGPLDIVFSVIGQRPHLFRLQVVRIQVVHLGRVPVGDEVDRVTVPHGKHVVGIARSDHLGRVGLQVVDPDVGRHAAAVPLPGPELPAHAVVRQLGAVGVERAQLAGGQRQHLGIAAVDGDLEQTVEPVPERSPAGAEQHGLAVGIPVEHAVIARVVGQAPGLAAGGGDHEDIVVAIVVAGEGHAAAVRRKFGEAFLTRVGGQLAGHAALAGDDPQVPGIGEDHLVAVDVGMMQQPRVGRRCERRGAQNRREREKHHAFHGWEPPRIWSMSFTGLFQTD